MYQIYRADLHPHVFPSDDFAAKVKSGEHKIGGCEPLVTGLVCAAQSLRRQTPNRRAGVGTAVFQHSATRQITGPTDRSAVCSSPPARSLSPVLIASSLQTAK